jgi:hypothetical protein
MRYRAAPAYRSPPRSGAAPLVLPKEASIGLEPHSAAKDAWLWSRLGLSPAVMSRAAALSGPTPFGFQEPWRGRVDGVGDRCLEVVDFGGEAGDPVGQQPQGPGRGAGGIGGHTGVELDASADEGGRAQPRQRLAQRWVGGHQHGFELLDGLGAGGDRRILGELEHPGPLHRSIAGLGGGGRATTKHRSGGGFGVDRVGLAASAPGGLVWLIDLDDLHACGP